MQKTTIFQGEVVDSTSPLISEQEAIQNAAFPLANYSYDPSMRQPTMNILPGWQGYSTSYNNYGYFYQPQQIPYIGQAVGLGANPYVYQQYYNPYQSNPAFLHFQQQKVPQTNKVYIPPYNINGEYLPLNGFDEKIENLKKEYWLKSQELAIRNSSNNYNQFGYNYYGNLYYQNYNNSLDYEISREVNKMQDEAREARKQFNVKLSKLAHNYIGAKYDSEKIEELYCGKVIENPYGDTPIELYQQNRFANLVPFDNSNMYRAYQAQVSAEYSAIIRPDSNMRECFDNMGIIGAQYELEEEYHRRKNLGTAYDTDAYKYFVRKKLAERNNILENTQNKIIPNVDLNFMNQNILNSKNQMGIYTNNPNNGGKLVATIPNFNPESGVLTLSCNFGSHAGQTYSVNQNEAKYEQDRERFNQFLDSIPKSIYPLNPGGN